MLPSDRAPAPVLLFDGECGLCNRIVRLLLRWDRHARLRFSPLQGPAAQAYLRGQGLPTQDFDSLVFVPDWPRAGESTRSSYLLRTNGVIAALRMLAPDSGAARFLATVISLFPAPLRDAGYRIVARCRYRLFGPWRPQPLRRPEWQARFLDPVSK